MSLLGKHICVYKGKVLIKFVGEITGALGSEIFPAVQVQLKANAEQIAEKAKQFCASKSVFLLYFIYSNTV